MKRFHSPGGLVATCTALAFPVLLTTPAAAQAVFSVAYTGATISTPDGFGGIPITEGDLLTAVLGTPTLGPLPPPGIDVSAGPVGLGLFLYPSCVGHPPATPCVVEVDALSYGRDRAGDPAVGIGPGEVWFSTDAYALGFPAGPPPDVSTVAPCVDLSADVFAIPVGMPPGPIPPFGAVVGNTAVVDGDGLPSVCGVVYPGLGLIEPSFPAFPPGGDDLDALNFDRYIAGGFGFPASGVYFSLDDFVIHPLSGVPGTGSGPAHGFSGADIIFTPAPGGPLVLWAPAPLLGLNLVAGGIDDLDAMAIAENGSGAFEPSLLPYDWLGGGTDMVLFSVRAGSAVVGMPDSIFGIPIEPGDILTTPLPTVFGGVSPFPGIFIAAENLGLLTTRSHGLPGDDLNALDMIESYMADCNGNGVYDQIDISNGTSTDINGNFIPDECELIGGPYCFCPAAVAPCGNPDPTAGCRNSTGVGGLLTGFGTGSVVIDNLVLTTTQLPTFQFGIYFGGPAMIGPLPFGDGLRCVGGGTTRFTTPTSTGATGTLTLGPGIAGSFGILPFSTMNFQCWYRDPAGPCASTFNTSNAFSVTFTP